jgi:hypothetical protein
MPTSVSSEETSAKVDDIGIDTNALKELAKRTLTDALNSVRGYMASNTTSSFSYYIQISGSKTLVLDPSLVGPLGLVIEVAALKVRHSDFHSRRKY